MNLIELILKELKLRDNGSRGRLGNLSDLELLCLAYKLGLTKEKLPASD